MQIAVLSDIHAYSEIVGPAEPSHLRVSMKELQPSTHPITALLQRIRQDHLTADLLLSAGDMGDKAQEEGIKYAWSAIHRIAAALGASLVGATPGNHDLDSRHLQGEQDPDPKGLLQDLVPSFPTGDRALDDRFWSQNFVLIESEGFRLLVLNSCAYHGGDVAEIDYGRVTSRTLSRIDASLQTSQIRPINIMLMHHHPMQHEEIGLGAGDVMKQGQLLLAMLGRGQYGEWLVVHGHKHHPKLSYGGGTSAGPVVFSVGSLCATLYRELQTHARNQFYIVTIDPVNVPLYGLVGRIRAYDWTSGIGWQPAGSRSGLPAECGFGYRTNPHTLARTIADRLQIDLALDRSANWSRLLSLFPQVDFLIPSDLDLLLRQLSNHHVDVMLNAGGVPYQVGLSATGAV
jgi:hypothetical protein